MQEHLHLLLRHRGGPPRGWSVSADELWGNTFGPRKSPHRQTCTHLRRPAHDGKIRLIPHGEKTNQKQRCAFILKKKKKWYNSVGYSHIAEWCLDGRSRAFSHWWPLPSAEHCEPWEDAEIRRERPKELENLTRKNKIYPDNWGTSVLLSSS